MLHSSDSLILLKKRRQAMIELADQCEGYLRSEWQRDAALIADIITQMEIDNMAALERFAVLMGIC